MGTPHHIGGACLLNGIPASLNNAADASSLEGSIEIGESLNEG
jgi:hypothetical protein